MAIGESFAKHETVKHSSHEYVRDTVHVNHADSVVTDTAGTAIAERFSRRHGSSDAPKPGR